MAYATDNPLRKIAEGGINSVWLYVDGDAVGTIAGSGYFDSVYENLKENDVILCVGAAGGTETVDLLVVTSATGATTVTTTNGT
jgi:histidyl-tRNA synthetase